MSTFNYPIPAQLAEAVNTVLVILYIVMFGFAAHHLLRIYRGRRDAFHGNRRAWLRCLRLMYWENKPSIAITVIVFSLLMRSALILHVAHYRNHSLPYVGLLADYAVPLFLVVSMILITGIVCWIRNISPFPIKNWQWVMLLSFATVAGYCFASYDIYLPV
jgi:hypothetical protein